MDYKYKVTQGFDDETSSVKLNHYNNVHGDVGLIDFLSM